MPSMPMPPLRSFYFPLAGGLLAGAAKAEQFRSSAAPRASKSSLPSDERAAVDVLAVYS